MMSMLIQGPNQPGNDIDVYLRLLVEELLFLWNSTGVRVWDEYKSEHFDLRALLFVTMIGLLLVIFQDSQTRDVMHACTVLMTWKVYF
jgi:hypothetical protein